MNISQTEYLGHTYFKFDGTQSINGATPQAVIDAFKWTADVNLWFVSSEGQIKYNCSGTEEDVKNFINDIVDPKLNMNVDECKAKSVSESKESLSLYLKNNPLSSTAHNNTAALYTVTSEKQYQLSLVIVKAMTSTAATPYEIMWNSTGNPSEVWTYEELLKLFNEIDTYVQPMVMEQQLVEKAINGCDTVDAIRNITADYKNCPYYNKWM